MDIVVRETEETTEDAWVMEATARGENKAATVFHDILIKTNIRYHIGTGTKGLGATTQESESISERASLTALLFPSLRPRSGLLGFTVRNKVVCDGEASVQGTHGEAEVRVLS